MLFCIRFICTYYLEINSYSKTTTHFFNIFRFFLADKSVGAKGFKATWTEVKDDPLCPPDMFQCEFSKYCISKQLTCNGIHNCGQSQDRILDQSDEKQAFCKFHLGRQHILTHSFTLETKYFDVLYTYEIQQDNVNLT